MTRDAKEAAAEQINGGNPEPTQTLVLELPLALPEGYAIDGGPVKVLLDLALAAAGVVAAGLKAGDAEVRMVPGPARRADKNSADRVAREFHETYERLAPQFEYETQEASAVPWEKVPAANKALMRAVALDLLQKGVIR